MQTIISVQLSRGQLSNINSHIPVNKRSKLIKKYILEGNIYFPKSKEEIEQLFTQISDTDRVNLPIFVSNDVVIKIDSLISIYQKNIDHYNLRYKITRSTIIRCILNEFEKFVEHSPIKKDEEKQFILIQMPSLTKDKFNKYIEKMERSTTIDYFIKEEFIFKPVNVNKIKERIPGERESFPLYLSKNTIDYIEELVDEYSHYKIKKTHIIRAAMLELLELLENNKSQDIKIKENVILQLEKLKEYKDKDKVENIINSIRNL